MVDEPGYMELDRPFTDPRLCAAIVDRLTHQGTIVEPAPRTASTHTRSVSPGGGRIAAHPAFASGSEDQGPPVRDDWVVRPMRTRG